MASYACWCLLLVSWLAWSPDLTSATGVPAEGPPVLNPLIGPAQEREAILRREEYLRNYPDQAPSQHHLRHQHHRQRHFGDPRLRGYPPVTPAAAIPGTTAPTRIAPTEACSVTPDQLVEMTRTSASRALEGICNAKEMDDRFHNLEAQLADQLNVLKTMILSLEDKVGAMDIGLERSERRLLASIAKTRSDQEESPEPLLEEDDGLDGDLGIAEPPPGPGARDEEVARLNNTVHTEFPVPGAGLGRAAGRTAGCGAGHRVFTYYWRVPNMEYKLTSTSWTHRRSLRSPSFYISRPDGYRMYLRLYPRQDGDKVYVHVGVTRGEYDENLQWPFPLKHRLAVLDQVDSLEDSAEDLVSRLWDPSQLCSPFNWQRPTPSAPDNYECVGLGFPQAVLRTRDYIRHDAVVVRLTVCLS